VVDSRTRIHDGRTAVCAAPCIVLHCRTATHPRNGSRARAPTPRLRSVAC